MPSPTRTLTARTARELAAELAFPEDSAERVGIEIEWFTTPSSDPPSVTTLRALLGDVEPLPYGSAITYEPGGQVELSSAPAASCAEACDAVTADGAVVRSTLEPHGIDLFATGLDPSRQLELVTDEQRYVAMKEYFDHGNASGRQMMCSTASVHVNVDAGRDEVGRRRWRLAHQLGPTLIAAFADSPIVDGTWTGWMSARMGAWLAIDPTRTAPAENGAAPHEAWASYALDANVMFIRTIERYVPVLEPLPFGRWIEDGHELGYPTTDDLAYHLTTLFPPVRPHGWLELRMIDMLPDPWWRAAAAVTTALLHDEGASSAAETISAPTVGMWTEAARAGMRHPDLRASVRGCFAAAIEALESDAGDPEGAELVAAYADRFVMRGRSPADDQLEALRNADTREHVAEAI